jgi:hypothetical protein
MSENLKTQIELLKLELKFSQLENKVYKQIILNANVPESIKMYFENFQSMVEHTIKEHTIKEKHKLPIKKTRKRNNSENTTDIFSIEPEECDVLIEPINQTIKEMSETSEKQEEDTKYENNQGEKQEQQHKQEHKQEQHKQEQHKQEHPVENSEEPKKTFKSIKGFVKNTEEDVHANIEKKIEEAEKKYEKIISEKGNTDTIVQKINQHFEKLKTSKIYQPILIEIKKERTKLLGLISIVEYIKILENHYANLKTFFDTKNYNPKKTQDMIVKSMSTIDLRLGHFKGYTTTTLEPDDMETFTRSLNLFINHQKEFIPCDNNTIYGNIKNYSIVMFELKDCIKRCVINTYGCNNIVYLNYTKSTPEDPYTFYILKKVDKARLWVMDCRLETFTLCLISNLLPYCKDLFRKIYKDVFEDNVHRENYTLKLNETKDECEQLLHNIITLAKPMEMCKIVQKIIMKECEITPSEIDKFDFYGDDKIQQKKFQKHFSENIKENPIDVIISLFDTITEEDAYKIVNSIE